MAKSKHLVTQILALAVLCVALAFGLCACAAAFAQEGDGAQGGATAQGQLAADGGSFLKAQDEDSGMWGTCRWERKNGVVTVHPGTAPSPFEGDFPWTADNLPWNDGSFNWDVNKVVFLSEGGERVTGLTNMHGMFSFCHGLRTVDFSGLDTSCVTDMWGVFYGCENLTSVDLSGLDTSSVKRMQNMFRDCKSLISVDLSTIDTSSLTDMWDMFAGCQSLASVDLSSFDTSNVTEMGGLFFGCRLLTSVDLSSFDTSNVKGMDCMFQNCSSLTSVDLSNLDAAPATRGMQAMFKDCTSLTSVDLSGLDLSNSTWLLFDEMFSGCSNLKTIDLSDVTVPNVAMRVPKMFYGCSSLETIYASNGFTVSEDPYDVDMFTGCTSLDGDNGTAYDSAYVDSEYARIDMPGAPGYFSEGALQEKILKEDIQASITFYAGNVDEPKNVPVSVKFGPSLFQRSSGATSQNPRSYYNQDLARLSIALSEVAYSEGIDRGVLKKTATSGKKGSGTVTAQVLGTIGVNQHTALTGYDGKARRESYVYNAYKSMGAKPTDVRSYYYEDSMYSWRKGVYPHGNADEGGYGACGYAIGKVKMEIAGEANDVVIVMVRGTSKNGEWNSNFNVANSGFGQDYHQGFLESERQIMDSLSSFCRDKRLDPAHTKILVTGHSRGAAVANLLAAHLDRMDFHGEGLAPRDNIYAYTFATPMGAIEKQSLQTDKMYHLYGNIFNIINPEDFVTKVALDRWGFYRYGTDLVLPSRTSFHKSYHDAYTKCNNKFHELFGGSYAPYLDGTASVDRLVDRMKAIAPNVREYYQRNEGKRFRCSPYEYFEALSDFLAGGSIWGLLNDSVSEYCGITAYFVGHHAVGEYYHDRILEQWKVDQPVIDAKVFEAHQPETYLAWMFAYGSDSGLFGQSMSAQDDDSGDPAGETVEETLFNGAYKVQRFYDCGNVRVYDSAGVLVCKVEDGVVDESVMENGLAASIGNQSEVVVYLPADDSYTFEVVGAQGARTSVESYDGKSILVGRAAASGLSGDGAYTGSVAEGEGAGGVELQAPGGSGVELVATAEGEEDGFVAEIATEGSGSAWTVGRAYEGEPITAYAKPAEGGEFLGWYDADGERLSGEAEYTFEAHQGVVLTAKFSEVAFTPTWARVSGSTRYATMAAIAEEAFPGGCATAVLVNGTDKNFPDALSAASLAGVWDCPIITTGPTSLHAKAREQLERLGVEFVYIIGGEKAVSPAVADEVASLNGGVEIKRIYGSTRYKTSVAVMQEVAKYRKSNTMFVATGTNFPDALAAGPLSYTFDSPILLVDPKKGLSWEQTEAIGECGAERAIILGGEKAVPMAIESDLYYYINYYTGGTVDRLSGSTRYETATMIADLAAEMGATVEKPVVATALSPADALAGAPLAGRGNSVILLTSEKKGGALAVGYLADRSGELERGIFLGGEKAISGGLAQKYLDATGATME